MIHRKLLWLYRLLVVTLIISLGACTTPTITVFPSSTDASSINASTLVAIEPTPVSLIQPTPVSTPHAPTVVKIGTEISTHIATRKPNPTLTSTPTPLPTLTDIQAAQLIANMIKTNGSCELPCWWGGGIIPGKTDFETAVGYFSSLGIPLLPSGLTGIDIPSSSIPFEYRVGIQVNVDQPRVEWLKMTGDVYGGEGYNSRSSERFVEDWKSYTWPQVFSVLGSPSQIRISAYSSNYAQPAGYTIVLFYDQIGLAFSYKGPAKDIGPNQVRVCPDSRKVTSIEMTMVSPDQLKSLTKLTVPSNDQPWPTLAEAASMNVETFYKTFQNAGSKKCLDVNVQAY